MTNEDKDITLTEISDDIPIIACKAENFPEGIQDSFTRLMQMVSPRRKIYGVSYCNGQEVEYYAGASEEYTGEGAEKGHLTKTIHKGKYLQITLKNWRDNIPAIKSNFAQLMTRGDVVRPAFLVEYYYDDDVDLLIARA